MAPHFFDCPSTSALHGLGLGHPLVLGNRDVP